MSSSTTIPSRLPTSGRTRKVKKVVGGVVFVEVRPEGSGDEGWVLWRVAIVRSPLSAFVGMPTFAFWTRKVTEGEARKELAMATGGPQVGSA